MSGGADSLALALLASQWAAGRGGSVLAMVADHGLRPESPSEVAVTLARLRSCGVPGCRLRLSIRPGTRLAERARAARHEALEAACAERGILHLLFGHHAADQAETVAMRRLRGSGPVGLAGMAALSETDHVRKLRPLLDVAPVRLRATLRAAGLAWIEDPSNADPAFERARLRTLGRDADGNGPLVRAAVEAARLRGVTRAQKERATADWLGRHVSMLANGHAHVHSPTVPPEAFAALVTTIGGRTRPPRPSQVLAWVTDPRAGTLGGVHMRRRGEAWLFVPERATEWAAQSDPSGARRPAVSLTPAPFVPVAGGDAETCPAPYLKDMTS